jgi:mRNA interferase MazF
MGHVPTAPALRCPADPRHVAFTGSQRACFDSSVTLDANGTVVRRVTGPLLYDVSNPRDHAIVCAVCGARAWRPWVPIPFMPADGMMLLCDFSTGFRPPEMVKMRPVVVLSHRTRNAQTSVVVPTSTVPPKRASAICILLDPSRHPFLDRTSYAKCEMITSVSRRRLFLFRHRTTGRGIDSRGTRVAAAELAAIRRGAAEVAGLVRLTS